MAASSRLTTGPRPPLLLAPGLWVGGAIAVLVWCYLACLPLWTLHRSQGHGSLWRGDGSDLLDGGRADGGRAHRPPPVGSVPLRSLELRPPVPGSRPAVASGAGEWL